MSSTDVNVTALMKEGPVTCDQVMKNLSISRRQAQEALLRRPEVKVGYVLNDDTVDDAKDLKITIEIGRSVPSESIAAIISSAKGSLQRTSGVTRVKGVNKVKPVSLIYKHEDKIVSARSSADVKRDQLEKEKKEKEREARLEREKRQEEAARLAKEEAKVKKEKAETPKRVKKERATPAPKKGKGGIMGMLGGVKNPPPPAEVKSEPEPLMAVKKEPGLKTAESEKPKPKPKAKRNPPKKKEPEATQRRKRSAKEREEAGDGGFVDSESSADEMDDDEKRYLQDMEATQAPPLEVQSEKPKPAPKKVSPPRKQRKIIDTPAESRKSPSAAKTTPSPKAKKAPSPKATKAPSPKEKKALSPRVSTPKSKAEEPEGVSPKASPKKSRKKKVEVATGKNSIEGYMMRGANEFKNRYERVMVTNEVVDDRGGLQEEDMWMYKEKATGKQITEEDYQKLEQAEVKRQNQERLMIEAARTAEEEAKAREASKKKQAKKEKDKEGRKTKKQQDLPTIGNIPTHSDSDSDESSDPEYSSDEESESSGDDGFTSATTEDEVRGGSGSGSGESRPASPETEEDPDEIPKKAPSPRTRKRKADDSEPSPKKAAKKPAAKKATPKKAAPKKAAPPPAGQSIASFFTKK
eukprot:TRINITY_DN34051_c0_g1_i1.p1 TRINITY_DN34051_c0_g1~~TRINITY_DN34051_c0_g1_i1.p1  ORF type:complete len:637 (+),score=223.47 TRINITY_DN34051_c0_g1_i1:40-1950(+)